jgi:two-component system, OmpR family, phosphate regulon response regulator PhoB
LLWHRFRAALSGKNILLFDDDAARRRLNLFGLRCAGFSVDEAADAAAVRAQIARRYPNLLILCIAALDVGVGDFVQRLRVDESSREVPVMVLAEKARAHDAETALEWGIDDFLAPPYSPELFVARVRVVAQRAVPRAPDGALEVAGLTLDGEQHQVRKGNRVAPLSPTDLRVLEFFLTHMERLIPREMLLFRIWGGTSTVSTRAVDVSVYRVRRALERIGAQGLLQTVSRCGYRLSTTAIDRRSYGG